MINIIKKYNIIVAFYFLFLILILAIFKHTPTNDTVDYINFAKVCISQGELYPCNALIYGHPFIWNIGSINLIVISLFIFKSIYPLLIFLCLLKALTALYIYKIAEYISNTRIAYYSLFIFIAYPNNWGQSTTLLSEIPMIFFAILSLYIALTKQNIKYLFTSGLILAISNWFRPIALVFIIILAIYFFKEYKKAFIKHLLPVITGYILMISVFGIETYKRTGYFVFQSETLWYDVVVKANDEATGHTNYIPNEKYRYIKGSKKMTCFECNEIWKKRSLSWIKSHPFKYASQLPYRLIDTYYSDIDNMSTFYTDKSDVSKLYVTLPYRHIFKEFFKLNYIQYLSIINNIFYYIIMMLFLSGMLVYFKYKSYHKIYVPIFIVLIGTFMSICAVHGETRFKTPFMPFIIIIAAYNIDYLYRKYLLR